MQINSSYREEDSRQFGHVSREFGTHTAPGSADGLSSQYDAREWTGLKGQPQIGVPEGGWHHTRAAKSTGPGSGAGERGTGPENALEPPGGVWSQVRWGDCRCLTGNLREDEALVSGRTSPIQVTNPQRLGCVSLVCPEPCLVSPKHAKQYIDDTFQLPFPALSLR